MSVAYPPRLSAGRGQCLGPVMDRDCGALYCPRDPQHEPEPGDSWQDCCDQCWALRGWSDELAGDCERDEE